MFTRVARNSPFCIRVNSSTLCRSYNPTLLLQTPGLLNEHPDFVNVKNRSRFNSVFLSHLFPPFFQVLSRTVTVSTSDSGQKQRVKSLLSQNLFRSKSTMATPTNGSLCRQNYNEECEAHINKQINMELYASYVYLSMAHYFDREDVALPGFYQFFKKNSDEEREHGQMFMKYQNKRGGRVVLQPIAKPTRDDWDGPLEAITASLELEKTVNQSLLDMHVVASRNSDPHLCDFLETHFLEEQVKAIKDLSDQITNLKRVGKGLGEYIFDKNIKE